MNQALPSSLRSIRSFVIREGRFTAAQKKAITELWPRYGIPNSAGKISINDYFIKPQPIVLDVGFGNGDSLISIAQQRRDVNFIGVEVYRPGIGNVLRQLNEQRIDNVRIVNTDIFELLRINIVNDSLQGILVWFPDPWPKKRHHKRRLVRQEFLQQVIRVIKPDGILHLASDWQPYVDAMIEEVANKPELIPIDKNEHVLDLTRPLTRFERRGLRLGHKVTDLVYRINKLRL